MLPIVDWPESAASWVRPAQRLTRQSPDALAIADTATGTGQLGRRLANQHTWSAGRTFGFASAAGEHLADLAGPGILPGHGAYQHHHTSHRPARPMTQLASRTRNATPAQHVSHHADDEIIVRDDGLGRPRQSAPTSYCASAVPTWVGPIGPMFLVARLDNPGRPADVTTRGAVRAATVDSSFMAANGVI